MLKFKERVHQITRRTGGRSILSRLAELRRYFQGWVGYFHYGLSTQPLIDFDKWTRRRIRACYWKQWYRVRTRIRMLLKLGVRRDEAFSHGSSGRGPWVMSKSAAMHVAISKDYLRSEGLVSLEEIRSKFASKKRNA